MPTENDIYIPTAGEQKLLQVLLNPEFYGKSVKDQCKAAGVTRTVYYDGMKKPRFKQLYNQALMEMMKDHIGEVVKATFRYATECYTAHQDRKMLLQMAGLYVDRTEIDHTLANKGGQPFMTENVSESRKIVEGILDRMKGPDPDVN